VLAVAERTGTPVWWSLRRSTRTAPSAPSSWPSAGDPAGDAALRRSVELAEETDLELVVVHVDEEIPRFTDQCSTRWTPTPRSSWPAAGPDLRGIRLELRLGAAADEILAAVETERPGLVAVGWPRTGPSDHGDVAREVLAHCRVPVLLVGPDRAGLTATSRRRSGRVGQHRHLDVAGNVTG